MSSAKFIFLDFDDVVCTNGTYKVWRKNGSPRTLAGHVSLFDAKIVALVNDICAQTGASIIVSSSWRLPDVQPHPLLDVMRLAGFTADIVGQTPYISAITPRGYEIAAYIKDHGLSLDQFVILDDDHMAPWCPKDDYKKHGGRWIQTTGVTGLTPKQALRAIKMLGGPIPSTVS